MKNSLQSEILSAVKKASPRVFSIDEVFSIAEFLNHKQSLAERKCRLLCQSGLIRAIRNEKGYVVSYQAVEATQRPQEAATSVLEPQMGSFKQEGLTGLKLPQILQ